jgi:hypothetical protein
VPTGYRGFGWALIALGKEAESVNLLDEVVNARPPSKSKADHQHRYHYKCVHYAHDHPSGKEEWRFLRRILDTHTVNTPQCQRLGKQSVQQRFLYWIFTYVTLPSQILDFFKKKIEKKKKTGYTVNNRFKITG